MHRTYKSSGIRAHAKDSIKGDDLRITVYRDHHEYVAVISGVGNTPHPKRPNVIFFVSGVVKNKRDMEALQTKAREEARARGISFVVHLDEEKEGEK